MLQCLVVAVRPLRVKELAELLAFEFDATQGGIPKYCAASRWDRWDDDVAVLSTCSSLVSVITSSGSRLVQLAHFSIKEFLMSNRLGNFSPYQILPGPSHTTLMQACLRVLLHLDDQVDKGSMKDFPLADYAAQHWVEHAEFGDVASCIKDGMLRC